MINRCTLEAVIASYLRGSQLPGDRETIAYLSQIVIDQAEMNIHSLIRQEVERIRKMA